MSDLDLLRLYVRERDNAAFAALVARHIDFVYSAARRQVRAIHLAEEVTQSVFTEVARRPPKLEPDQPFFAWLYVVTRRTAIDVVRSEARRRARETTAIEIAAMQTPAETWSQMEVSIDEAMAALNDTERNAILLRFFQNLSLREVGETLGISEDTAQKRVSRALDRLRTFFAGRGVAVGSAAFTASLSAHAIQAAPAGLALAISASTLAIPAVTVVAIQHLAMTAAQKILVSCAVAAALGLALYEGIPAFRLHRQVQEGAQRLEKFAVTARELRLERTALSRQLSLQGRSPSSAPTSAEAESDAALTRSAADWNAGIARLKEAFAQRPELAIPELQLLTDADWVRAARGQDFSREDVLRGSLFLLRTWAKNNFLGHLSAAVKKYLASAQALPTRFDQLLPLVQPAVDPAILARYEFQGENGRIVIAERLAGALDLQRLAVLELEFTKAHGLHQNSHMESAVERSARETARSAR